MALAAFIFGTAIIVAAVITAVAFIEGIRKMTDALTAQVAALQTNVTNALAALADAKAGPDQAAIDSATAALATINDQITTALTAQPPVPTV